MDKKEFSYNSKFYKTEAAMKKAKTMNIKREIKKEKQEAYSNSKKAITQSKK